MYMTNDSFVSVTDPPGQCDAPLDLVFVIDSSGSINFAGAGNWDRVLKFVNDIVSKRVIGPTATRVGVVRYSTEVDSMFYLNTYNNKDSLKNAITGISYKGRDTNTAGGIREMRTVQFTAAHGDRPSVPNVAIVITDGESKINPEQTVPEAQIAHGQGITVYSIGITEKVNRDEVSGISSPPHDLNQNYFLRREFTNLDNLIQTIIDATCHNMDPVPASKCIVLSARSLNRD